MWDAHGVEFEAKQDFDFRVAPGGGRSFVGGSPLPYVASSWGFVVVDRVRVVKYVRDRPTLQVGGGCIGRRKKRYHS